MVYCDGLGKEQDFKLGTNPPARPQDSLRTPHQHLCLWRVHSKQVELSSYWKQPEVSGILFTKTSEKGQDNGVQSWLERSKQEDNAHCAFNQSYINKGGYF